MARSLGVNALHPELCEVVRRHDAHQGACNLGVVGIGFAAKRLSGVGVLIAGNPLPQAKLERIEVGIRVVRHFTVSRIASAEADPQFRWVSPPTGHILDPGH